MFGNLKKTGSFVNLEKSSKFIKRKRVCAFLFAAVFIILLTGSLHASAVDYENHWARATFDEWIRLGILVPDSNGNIHPDEPITRGELCSYINKILGYVVPADISQYTDTPPGSRYHWDMAVALNAGYIMPSSPATLSPAMKLTREQVIYTFVRVAKIVHDSADLVALAGVRDASQISDNHRNAVASSISNGFIAGRDGFNVKPKDYMTVSETIVLLDRLNSGKRVYGFPGTYGPETGNIVSNYTTIMAFVITLNNAHVSRDLDIHSNTGDGDIYLNYNTVEGTLFINGGRNIYISGVNAGKIEINKKGANLIYATDRNSYAGELVINSDGVTVDINRGNKTKKIVINGRNAKVNIGENVIIEELTVNGDDALINLAKGSRLENVVLNARTQIRGDGTIGHLKVNPGGDGSVIDPRPETIDIDEDTYITIDNKEAGSTNPKIKGGSFLFPITVKVNTDDIGSLNITERDFRVEVDGAPVTGFTVSKVSTTEFNLILPMQISPSSRVRIAGVNNLTGSVTISQSSQPQITDAVPSDMKTIEISITNPEERAFSKENFKLEIAGKNDTGFMITAKSPTLYNLIITSAVKSGQIMTVTGQNGLGGYATFGAVSAVKSIIFEDATRFLVNTDDTSGNKINTECFDVTIGGSSVQDFTVNEISKTSFRITVKSKLAEGTEVIVAGKKFLTGRTISNYAEPFRVSKVTTTDIKTISVVLASAPTVSLNAESHADSFQVFVDDTRIPVTGIRKDILDKKNTTFDLTVDLTGMQGMLTVNRTKESKNKGMIDFVDPELIAVRMNDKYLNINPPLNDDGTAYRVEPASAKLVVEFSEPVFKSAPSSKFGAKDVALSGAAFNIITGNGKGFDSNGVKVTMSGNSVVIDLAGAKMLVPGLYTITVDKNLIFDSFGNVCGRNRGDRVSYKFNIIGSVPTLVSAKQVETGDIDIKLSGAISDSFGTAMSLEGGEIEIWDGETQVGKTITYHYISYDVKNKTISINRDAYNANKLSKDTYKLMFKHPDYIHFEVSKIKIDTIKPKILKVTIKDEPLIPGNRGEPYTVTDEDGKTETVETPLPRVTKANAIIQIEFSKPVFASPPSKKFTSSDLHLFSQPFNVDASDSDNIDLTGSKLSSNNRMITIALNTSAQLRPDMYMLRLDGGIIYDSVGNEVDEAEILSYYFYVVRLPPNILSAQQQRNGDINIRFSRYSAVSRDYRRDICDDGVFRIYDLNGKLIQEISPEFIERNDTNEIVIIKREGLDPNIKLDYYYIEIEHWDYETAKTPNLRIYTTDRNWATITVGGNKRIPLVTGSAENNRITVEDAVIRIAYGSPVQNNTGNVFNNSDFAVIDSLNKRNNAAFTLYIEGANQIPLELDLSKVKVEHAKNSSVINIDLSEALKDDAMMYATFIFTIDETLVFDTDGIRTSNEYESRNFKLTRVPFPLKSAEQVENNGTFLDAVGNRVGGYVVIKLEDYITDGDAKDTLERSIWANTYGNSIDGTNLESGVMSTIRIENAATGAVIGYIPGRYVESDVTYDFIAKTITINRNALENIVSTLGVNGERIYLNGGNYTLVLNHSFYADNRIDLKIDTTPPEPVKGYPRVTAINKTDSEVTVTFNYPSHKKLYLINDGCYVEDKKDGNRIARASFTVAPAKPNVITVTFDVTDVKLLPLVDYKINISVYDQFSNKSVKEVFQAVPLEPHKERINGIVDAEVIPGFKYNPDALNPPAGEEYDSQFQFGSSNDEGNKFSDYYEYDGNTKMITVKDADLKNKLMSLLQPGETTIIRKSQMTVTIPSDAVSYRYTADTVASFTDIDISGASINVATATQITLENKVEFEKADIDAPWIVNLPKEGYYIFEWTTADEVYYTYVYYKSYIDIDHTNPNP